MPTEILAVVEDHLERSRRLNRWQQKKVFEAAAKVLRRRLEEENAAATGGR